MCQKSWWYDLQFLRCRGGRLKLVILGHLLPFYLPKNPKNQNFGKMKKILVDNIILHMCTKNHCNVMSGSWDVEWDRQNI